MAALRIFDRGFDLSNVGVQRSMYSSRTPSSGGRIGGRFLNIADLWSLTEEQRRLIVGLARGRDLSSAVAAWSKANGVDPAKLNGAVRAIDPKVGVP
jgi:hypothetical protein